VEFFFFFFFENPLEAQHPLFLVFLLSPFPLLSRRTLGRSFSPPCFSASLFSLFPVFAFLEEAGRSDPPFESLFLFFSPSIIF